jgi:hypothetical protein
VERETPNDVVYNPNARKFLVLYQDLRTYWWNIWARHVSITGTMDSKIQITTIDSDHEAQGAVAYDPDDDQYLVAYTYRTTPGSPRDIRARRLSSSGVVTSETILVATGSTNQTIPEVAYLSGTGKYVVAWEDEWASGTGVDICARLVSPSGSLASYLDPIAQETQDEDEVHLAPDGTGNVFMLWERPNGLQGYDLFGGRLRVGIRNLPLVEAERDQRGAAVANDGAWEYLVAWHDNRSGDTDIYARLHYPGRSDPFVVVQATNNQSVPSVAYNPDDDQYLIVWQDGRDDADNPDIYAQRISGAGVLVGNAFTVTTSPYRRRTPYVAYAPGENVYLAIWRHYPGTGDNYFDVYGQLISNTGTLVGAPLPIAARTGSADRETPNDIVYNPDARKFLALYQDLRTGYWNIWGRHVSVTGTMDSKIQVTTIAGAHEAQGAVAYDPDDDQYLVAYTYRSSPSAPRDIRARRLSGSGVVTSETVLVATGPTNQTTPDVVYLPQDGRYTVVWSAELTLRHLYLPLVVRNDS